MSTSSTHYLRDNAGLVGKLVRDAFSGSADIEVKGRIVCFNYAETDCSDFSKYDLPSKGQLYGPGFQVLVKFPHIILPYFYAEKECQQKEQFIDLLNTDAGMAQIMYGKQTKNLNINYYDLQHNLIRFVLSNGEAVRKAALDQCWDPKTSTFNVEAFLQLRRLAEKEAGITPNGESSSFQKTIKVHAVPLEK